ncbi:MAG: hypothetical protein ACLQU1_41570 [Bryobacteraceae bacterium]
MTEQARVIHNPPPHTRWERSNRGTLFLRQHPKLTLGIVFQNDDHSFSWVSRAYHRDEPLRYPSEYGACDALLTVLGM